MNVSEIKYAVLNMIGNKNNLFKWSYDNQEEFLNKLGLPDNDVERSYFQYKCQMKLEGLRHKILYNTVSIFLIPYFYYKTNTKEEGQHYDIVFMANGNSDKIVPRCLREEYGRWKKVIRRGESLDKNDKAFFKDIVRMYPFSFYFLLKVLIKLRYFSFEINSCKPQAVLSCDEYSFATSAMTYYCNLNSVIHINVMHGEKLYNMRDSFFRFDRCYVWDQHYIDLFCALKAEKHQFIVELPEMMLKSEDAGNKTIDFTYYLGGENEETLKRIEKSLLALKGKGYKVIIRPHPIYATYKKVKKVIKEIELEENLDIDRSIVRSRYAIARFSTVLNRAYYNGVSVVIDDISSPDEYSKLRELQYIMLFKEHLLLSDILKEGNSVK